jgi:hypothetical protein
LDSHGHGAVSVVGDHDLVPSSRDGKAVQGGGYAGARVRD